MTLHHDGGRHDPEDGDGRTHDPGGHGKDGRREDDAQIEGALQRGQQIAERPEQAGHQVRPLDDVPHEDEEGNSRQDLFLHHPEGLDDHEIENHVPQADVPKDDGHQEQGE